jgi:hypothetical protein
MHFAVIQHAWSRATKPPTPIPTVPSQTATATVQTPEPAPQKTVLELLLLQKADVNAQTKDGSTPLLLTCCSMGVPTHSASPRSHINLILEAGASPHIAVIILPG